MKFTDRENEIGHLEKEYSENKPKFLVLYGRRRVGKTRLIEEFIKNKKDPVYYMAAQETDKQQIKEFKNILGTRFKDEFLLNTKIDDWKQLFEYLKKIWPEKERIILAIDEVTFIIKSNHSFPSYLQRFWDESLSKTNTFLILSGSLIGLMLKEVLDYPSPLYGRRTSQMLLEPLDFKNAAKFLETFSFEDKIRYYGIIGGVPKYLELVTQNETVESFIKDKFLKKEGFFYQEALFLISQEFQEPSTYTDILKAISSGNTKLNEISSYTGIDTKKISRYLDILSGMGLIQKAVPVTEDEKKSRKSIYVLKDPFLAFWHRFVQPNRSHLEMRQTQKVWAMIEKELGSFIGKAFEEICMEAMPAGKEATKTGRWWSRKGDEIDIVSLNEKSKEIIFAECKWKNNVDPQKLLLGLKEKAKLVEWNKEKRIQKYAIFAKSFKNKIKEENLLLYDLKDLEKIFEANDEAGRR